ncbi:MAG: patatin-like phospholipase family protein [Microbacterium sp.]|nr:patatin-like phospholipase family protein [Microbacterium sp.]
MNDSSFSSPSSGGRALVLGGGGSTGNAWLLGVVGGLAEAGLDVAAADLLIGTSAGATTAVQLAASSPAALLDAVLAPMPPRARPDAGAPASDSRTADPRAGAGVRSVADNMARTAGIIAASSDAADMRRRMGAEAFDLDADGSQAARWRATVASRLPTLDWPERRMLIPAVDAATGEAVVFDRDSGVDLADAVAASCSSGFAYRIGDRRFIDGGYRRNENADLASGYGRVLVLSPFGGRTRHPLAWRMQLDAQVEDLRAAGSAVETVRPGEEFDRMIGPRAMDPSLRPDAARIGRAQGLALAPHLAAFWA